MGVTLTYPGVYIEEFTPAAPIQGVGTSTAGFLGISAFGVPDRPERLTSWDAFVQKFTDGGDPADDDYLWYAVRGFFENGGRVCFFTPVSDAAADTGKLLDSGGRDTLLISARAAGVQSPSIKVTATATPGLGSARLSEPSATVDSTAADLKSVNFALTAEAASFLPGDKVLLDPGIGHANEEAVVSRVVGSQVFFVGPLQADRAGRVMQLAPLDSFATTFRVDNARGLVEGSIVKFSQTGVANPFYTIVTSVTEERVSGTQVSWRVTVKAGLDGFTLYKAGPAAPIMMRTLEFRLEVSGMSQPYEGLSMSSAHPRWVVDVVNNDLAGSIRVSGIPGNSGPAADNMPKASVTLRGGRNHDAALLRQAPLQHYQRALNAMVAETDINIVVAPDSTNETVQKAVLAHCSGLAERFAVLDAAPAATIDAVLTQRGKLIEAKGFAALYHPWLLVASMKTGKRIPVPPSGHVAGIYARTDLLRGVQKAPAGTECDVRGSLGVQELLSDADQGEINKSGVNAIRIFQNGGTPVVWGARTTTDNTNWQYVNIRRLFIFLEESIQQGIRGSVFEPNNPSLWKRLNRTISAFLTQQWRDGALFGNTREEAFYVRIDEILNPDSQRALGRLTIEIGVRPSYPAEFIVVRIGIWQGGSTVSEA